VLRDDDVAADATAVASFTGRGGTVFSWRAGRAIETELFASLSDVAIDALINAAIELLEHVRLIPVHILRR
jgi:hypothetical protein